MIWIGETQVLLDIQKIKAVVDHAGLSQPPVLLRVSTKLDRESFQDFLNNNLLIAPSVLVEMLVAMEDGLPLP